MLLTFALPQKERNVIKRACRRSAPLRDQRGITFSEHAGCHFHATSQNGKKAWRRGWVRQVKVL